jgi:hypothetical protein
MKGMQVFLVSLILRGSLLLSLRFSLCALCACMLVVDLFHAR